MAVENPAGVPVTGPGSPYITPAIITSASTGISWSTIPDRGATAEQQYAAQLDICARATAAVDTFCNQPLRATVDVEMFTGPGEFRCQLQPSGVARLLASRGPVLLVVAAQTSAAGSFPRSWNTIPANQVAPEKPLIGVYGTSAPSAAGDGGQGILLAPGWVSWWPGRLGTLVQVTYLNGWPHASLTAAAAAAASSLVVDDITGWAGAAGNVYDGGANELVTCTAVTPATTGAISGPGTLTLSGPLTYPHPAGTLVSTLPANVQLAAIYYAVAQALTRGATATAVQMLTGTAASSGPASSSEYEKMAAGKLYAYRRVI